MVRLQPKQVREKLSSVKVLVVGAGGIGCELIKNIAMSGIKNIEIIDLDTIEVSNLNRQFLFRKNHVGSSKSKIASESILKSFPNLNLIAHHGNIKESKFGFDYFKQFDLIFNALDNIEARNHVNRMCVSIDKPLVEAGTGGYIGQVMPIKKGVTKCFECEPIRGQKSFAVCTIRSTPEKPIHCITWGKYLFELLFGPDDDSNLLQDLKLALQNDSDPLSYATKCFEKFFDGDIQAQIDIDPIKRKNRRALSLEHAKTLKQKEQKTDENMTKDQKLLGIADYAQDFLDQVVTMLTTRKEEIGLVRFDKDDDVAMRFVTAASNLRSYNYTIELSSLFKVKEIAGNIIPAIGSTNAIAAGLQVMEGIKLLFGEIKTNRKVTIQRLPSTKQQLLVPIKCEEPKEDCPVCSKTKAKVDIYTDVNKFLLSHLVTEVLRKHLSMNEPSVSIGYSAIYETGDGLEEDEIENYEKNFQKELSSLTVRDGAVLNIDDYSQDLQLQIIIHQKDDIDADEFPQGFMTKEEVLSEKQKEEEEDLKQQGDKRGNGVSLGVRDGVATVIEEKEEGDPQRVEEIKDQVEDLGTVENGKTMVPNGRENGSSTSSPTEVMEITESTPQKVTTLKRRVSELAIEEKPSKVRKIDQQEELEVKGRPFE